MRQVPDAALKAQADIPYPGGAPFEAHGAVRSWPQLEPRHMSPASPFHPAVARWFRRAFPVPTSAQARAWPAIQAGRHVLIAAPTGSGKTLAAFLAAIDSLVRQGLEGRLED